MPCDIASALIPGRHTRRHQLKQAGWQGKHSRRRQIKFDTAVLMHLRSVLEWHAMGERSTDQQVLFRIERLVATVHGLTSPAHHGTPLLCNHLTGRASASCQQSRTRPESSVRVRSIWVPVSNTCLSRRLGSRRAGLARSRGRLVPPPRPPPRPLWGPPGGPLSSI